MGLFRRIFKRSSTTSTATAATAGSGAYSLLAPSLIDPLAVATVYRSVYVKASSVASLDLSYQRLKDGIFSDWKGNRLWYLLNVSPSPAMSARDFWMRVVQDLDLRGNAYIVPEWDSSTMSVARLVICDPNAVAHDVYLDRYVINDTTAGVHGVFDEPDIIHLKNFTLDGKTGLSTLSYARLSVSIAGTGDKETLNRFQYGGAVRGIVSNMTGVKGFGEYQDEELSKTAVSLDDKFSSGSRIVSLPGEVQFSPISMSSTDMQFLETRKFSVRELCRFFGVPPSFVFDDTSTNYKSAELANNEYLNHTLEPILRNIENELLRKLVPESLADRRRFRFDRTGILSLDLSEKVDYQLKSVQAGLSTVNELRRAENKPPIEGGDQPLVSANLKSLAELRKESSGTVSGPDPDVQSDNDNQDGQKDDS